MSAEGFKLDPDHSADCWMTADELRDDTVQFIVPDGVEHDRRRNGHHGGSTGWYRFRCNDPKCPAVALVRWDKLGEFITAGIKADPKGLRR